MAGSSPAMTKKGKNNARWYKVTAATRAGFAMMCIGIFMALPDVQVVAIWKTSFA